MLQTLKNACATDHLRKQIERLEQVFAPPESGVDASREREELREAQAALEAALANGHEIGRRHPDQPGEPTPPALVAARAEMERAQVAFNSKRAANAAAVERRAKAFETMTQNKFV